MVWHGIENAGNLVLEPGTYFRVTTTISLVAGTTYPYVVERANNIKRE